MKIGRNEACPCGSGKKYKKCCLKKDSPEDSPEEFLTTNDLMTGTLLDDYHILFKSIAFYGRSLRQFSEDKKELTTAAANFERMFKPGESEGVSSGLFMTWLHFDFRFGSSNKTIIHRYIDEGFLEKLVEPGPSIIQDMAMSYCGFYEITALMNERIKIKELLTGHKFQIVRIGDDFENEARVGDIWYTRLVGPNDDEVYCFIAPFVFEPGSKVFFEHMLQKQVSIFREKMHGNISKEGIEDLIFALSCKDALTFWAKYFTQSRRQESEPSAPLIPAFINSDREVIHCCKIFFDVKNEKFFREKLKESPDFIQEEPHAWVWLKKPKRKGLGGKTVLGAMKLEGLLLTAELNSLKRALKLKRLLVKEMGESIVYQRIDAKSLDAMPRPEPEQIEKFEKEQESILSNPLVRSEAEKRVKDYYFKSWIRQKIPMLGFKTPMEASKTPEGREELKELFARMEGLSSAVPDKSLAKMNFTELKKKLGIMSMSRRL